MIIAFTCSILDMKISCFNFISFNKIIQKHISFDKKFKTLEY
jgi:hypothetical protein